MGRHLVALGLLLLPCRSTAAQADTVWRLTAGSDIQRVRDCPAPELLVVTKTSLLAVNAVTGTKLWERTDLPNLGWGLYLPCEEKTGVSYRGDKIVAFDVVSGQQRWDATALPAFSEVRATVAIPANDVLLLFLRTATSDRSLSAHRLSSGERLWQRDDVFQVSPAFAMHVGVSDIDKFQFFVVSGDTSLMMYLSLDGPIHIDLRTGATRWKGTALAGQPVPSLDDYARMRLVDSTLVIPREKGLVGVDARSGQVRWQNDTLLPRRATRLAPVPAGIFVRAGTNYANVLDPATGTFRWSQPITLRVDGAGRFIDRTNGAAYTLGEDRYYFVSRDRFMVADLATGDTTGGGSEKLRFKDHEWASLLVRAGDDFVVISRQNLFRLDGRGVPRYQRFYNAPGTSFLQQMGGIYGTYGSAAVADQYAYFVTNEPDAAGRKGNSLLRVALGDGSEAGRIWLKEKGPTYWPDATRDQVFMLADDKVLVAIRFSR